MCPEFIDFWLMENEVTTVDQSEMQEKKAELLTEDPGLFWRTEGSEGVGAT